MCTFNFSSPPANVEANLPSQRHSLPTSTHHQNIYCYSTDKLELQPHWQATMVKTVYHYSGPVKADLGPEPMPPPPPLPEYDPKVEAPKWDWYRVWFHFPKAEKDPDRPTRAGQAAVSDDKPDWRGVIKKNVIPLPTPEPYKFGRPVRPHYFYFDTPDYADPFKKLWYAFKWFAATGGIMCCSWAILQSRKFDLANHRWLFANIWWPWFTGGMIFSTTAITTANLRGNKDDMYNYLVGGLVTGAVNGRRSYIHHLRHTALWVPLGLYAKYNAETNGNMAMLKNPHFQSHGMSGLSAEGGFFTGDLRIFPNKSHPNGDPGRDVKRLTL